LTSKRYWPVTPAACMQLWMFLSAVAAAAPLDGPQFKRQSLAPPGVIANGSATDSIIHLKQWQAEYGGNDHWYGILAVQHYWVAADSIARTLVLDTMSGYLATIQGASEDDFIYDSVLGGANPPTVEDLYWLGGELSGDAWEWNTGEPLCYQNWAGGEPDYPSTQTVLTIWGPPEPSFPGSWYNMPPGDTQNTFANFWAVVEWGDPNLLPVTICGNGVAECEEICDDGNLTNGDGCEATCVLTCVPGDVNASWSATASDVINLVNYIFLRGPGPLPCWYAGDMNCNSQVTSADVISLINYVFKSMPLAECDRCEPCQR